MSLDDKIPNERNRVSEIVNLVKRRIKSPYFLSKIVGLSLLTVINCYQPKESAYLHNSEIMLLQQEHSRTKSVEDNTKDSIDDAVAEEVPFTFNSDDPEKQHTFALIQAAVKELRGNPSYKFKIRDEYLPLYMAIVQAETDFQVDTISDDDPKKTWCRTISDRGAVGPGQIMPSSVPASEPLIRARNSKLKERCRSLPRSELATLDARFDSYKNIVMMIRNINESIAAFPVGAYTYYGIERNNRVVGRKSQFPDTEYTHSMNTATQRDRMLLAAAGFNRGIYNVMGIIAKRKPANASEVMRLLGGTGGYAYNVNAIAGRYTRMIAKNPHYSRQLYAQNE